MLNSGDLFDKEFRVSTCQLAHLKPFTYPQTQKVPRLLARNLLNQPIKIDKIYTLSPGISAGIKSTSHWLAIKIGNDTAYMIQHVIIALQQITIVISLTQKNLLICLGKDALIPLTLLISPPLTLSPIRNNGNQFQFRKLFLELDDLLGCQHVKAHRHARDKVSETQHVKQPNLSPHLPSKLRNLLRSNRAMPRKGNALCLAQNQFHTFYIYNVF